MEENPNDQPQRLLEDLQRKDTQAWEWLTKSLYPKILKWVGENQGRVVGSSEDNAKDLFRDVLTDFYEKLVYEEQTFVLFPGATVEGYLFQCCRNRWMNTLRKHKRRGKQLPIAELGEQALQHQADSSPDPQMALVIQEEIARVEATLRKLSHIDRRLVQWYLCGHDIPDIMRSFGYANENVARASLGRALRNLREALRRYR